MNIHTVLAFVLPALVFVPGGSSQSTRIPKRVVSGQLISITQPQVVGGVPATNASYPYQVSLEYGTSAETAKHVCGGAILSKNIVVTAAHCITSATYEGYYFFVRAGMTELSDPNSQMIQVANATVHPDFLGGISANDIAILKLASNLTFNSLVAPINLPVNNSVPTGNATLTGWGSISTNASIIMPDNLQVANVTIITFAVCAQYLFDQRGTSVPLNETNVCSGPLPLGGLGSCVGDSGGPLAQNSTLVGIVSWGSYPCGRPGAPSIYTRVSAFLDFIAAHSI